MRTFSTPESALKGEITKLGIIECALAVAVYVAVALGLHTFRYFYLAIALAPLTLFRTDESTEWIFRAFQTIQDKLGRQMQRLDKVPAQCGCFLLIPLVFLICMFVAALPPMLRVAGIVYGFARWPVRTIVEMPRNWVRQALCTDFAHPPEALPGELYAAASGVLSRDNDLTFPRLFKTPVFRLKPFCFEINSYAELLMLFASLAMGLLLYLPPLLYRISFKATAVCYLPFLWVAQATTGSKLPLKVRLERVTKGEWEKRCRGLAVLVLGVFGLVVALHFGIIDLTFVTSKFPTELAAVHLIGAMNRFQWWHATLLVDALLTYWLLFFSDAALPRIDTQVWSESFVANTLSMTSFFRGALAVLTMTYGCLVAILNVVPAGVRGFSSTL